MPFQQTTREPWIPSPSVRCGLATILPGLQFKVEPVATSPSACGCRPKILMRRQIGGHWPTSRCLSEFKTCFASRGRCAAICCRRAGSCLFVCPHSGYHSLSSQIGQREFKPVSGRTCFVMACPEYSRVLTDTDDETRYRTTPNTVMQRLAALVFSTARCSCEVRAPPRRRAERVGLI
jgi:hypothetical protein